jgi:hypothetical protein
MCECSILVKESPIDPFEIPKITHQLYYTNHLGKTTMLLSDFELEGKISHVEIRKISDSFNMSSGYMILIGEHK